MPDLHLPDVSEYQPNVDWPAVVKRNGGAAIIRAFNGYRADKAWYGGARRRAFWKAAGPNGVLGFYAYVVKGRDVIDQARGFISVVGRLNPGEFAVMDLEEGDGDLLPRAQAWLDYVDRNLPHPAGYAGAWLYPGWGAFCIGHNLSPIMRSKRHTWIAAYSAFEPTDPRLAHTLWQHTSDEPWVGVGKCDCSIFHGSLAQLRAKVDTPAAVAPKPAPAPAPAPAKPAAHVPTLPVVTPPVVTPNAQPAAETPAAETPAAPAKPTPAPVLTTPPVLHPHEPAPLRYRPAVTPQRPHGALQLWLAKIIGWLTAMLTGRR